MLFDLRIKPGREFIPDEFSHAAIKRFGSFTALRAAHIWHFKRFCWIEVDQAAVNEQVNVLAESVDDSL